MSSEPPRQRLPFEPATQKKKSPKKAAESPVKAAESRSSPSDAQASMTIPEAVSQRMIRRMALFCGIPTALGIASFVGSYFIVRNDLFTLPTTAVVFISIAWFGLGFFGLTYGVLSASWDEDRAGDLLGWQEFTTNFGRMKQAWQANSQKSAVKSQNRKG